jgi:radical SAM superfamily enzyme YgiQ (UPF0313 family)
MAEVDPHPLRRGAPVLLLNPPWRETILRDYFCTSVAKTDYCWHPIDLLAQTGHMAEAGLVPHVLDAVAERLHPEAAARRVQSLRPNALYCLTSPLTEMEDTEFLSRWPDVPRIVSGEGASTFPEDYLGRNTWADAVVQDFTSPALAAWLCGERDPVRLPGLVYRDGDRVQTGHWATGPFRLHEPRHELFPAARYRMPGMKDEPFATFMTDFGCTHRCTLCNSGRLGHRLRDMDDAARELARIREMGFGQVFLKDMAFGRPRHRAEAICDLFAASGLSWTAYVRPDDMDGDLARLMAQSGCRLVRMGVESGDAGLRQRYGKNIDDSDIMAAAHACKAAGLGFGVHIVLGIPGESMSTLRSTRRLLRAMEPDYVSLNLAHTRSGSADHVAGVTLPESGTGQAAMAVIRDLMYLDFYLRPAWVRNALDRAFRNGEVAPLLRSGMGLARSMLKRR